MYIRSSPCGPNRDPNRTLSNELLLLIPTAIEILGGTIYYIIGKGIVYIPLLMDDSSTYIVATKAFFISKSPYKLILELAFKKRK